jgi:hypothetical protein
MKQQEHIEQAAVFAWARLAEPAYPELALLFAVPNGGVRNKVTAARLKAEGVKRGVPDMWLPVARGDCHGLVIELKAKGGRPTPEQRVWLAALEAQGWRALVCVGREQAIAALEQYLGMAATAVECPEVTLGIERQAY